jgi:pimeloyl-ACP methyl ester carboxylesterase
MRLGHRVNRSGPAQDLVWALSVDPNSGRHMAQRYLEVIPNPDVVMLDDDIGHWPQIEAPDAVLAHFLDHIERVTARR